MHSGSHQIGIEACQCDEYHGIKGDAEQGVEDTELLAHGGLGVEVTVTCV